jgi:hypothetical protein
MSCRDSGITGNHTMTGAVGGALVLPVARRSQKIDAILLRPFRPDQAHALKLTRNHRAFPLFRSPFRKSGVSNPHRLA